MIWWFQLIQHDNSHAVVVLTHHLHEGRKQRLQLVRMDREQDTIVCDCVHVPEHTRVPLHDLCVRWDSRLKRL